MKRLLVVSIILLSFLLSLDCSAEEIANEDVYKQQYENINADDLGQGLPDDVKEYMDGIDISGLDTSWTEQFTPKNIFGQMWEFIKSRGKRPIASGCSIIAVLLFGSVASGMMPTNKSVDYVMTVGILSAAIMPAISTVISSVSAIKSAGTFMLSFIPIFAAALVSRGKTLTAAGFSSVMLVVSEAVSTICSLVITPMVGMQLGLSVSGSVLNDFNTSSVGRTIKRISSWVLGLCVTVVLAVLGIQTLINGSADSLKDKTAKFVIGSAVPIVGGAVSEALGTVKGCLKILGSSVAIYGIVALAVLFLPVVVELLLWRVALLFTAMISDVLGKEKASALIRSVDSAVAFVLGIMIFIGVLFIISVTMVSLV